MNRWLKIIAPLTALLIVGCNQGDGTDPPEEGNVGADEEIVQSTWVEIAAGVWERPRPEGGFERRGFGPEGFRFALERAQQENLELLDPGYGGDAAALDERLQKNLELIDYLQSSLEEIDEGGEHEQRPHSTAGGNSLAAPSSSPSSAKSGYACAGNYNLDVKLYYGMVSGTVKATASWSEFGPFAPFQKFLHTYAYAWTPGYTPPGSPDIDSYGPFSHTCCASVSSSATVDMTFEPKLYGSAYINVTNGCSLFEFYELSNY